MRQVSRMLDVDRGDRLLSPTLGAHMAHIFGYEWEDIQRAQHGGRLQRRIDLSRPVDHSLSAADAALVAEYKTVEALTAAGYHGTADKLKRST